MDRLEIETPFGPIWLWGRDTGKPVLLVIHGAFAGREGFGPIPLTDVDVFEAHLPGNHCPELIAPNLGVWSAAFGHAVRTRFGDRHVGVVGVSTGALIGLGMHAPQVKRLLLIEPPLRPSLAWPLWKLRTEAPDWGREMVRQVFGVGPLDVEARDYSHLLAALTKPTIALLGGVPLMPIRDFKSMPSLVDEASRADLRAHRFVQVREVPGVGHNVPRDAPAALTKAVADLRVALHAGVARAAHPDAADSE